MKVRSWLVVVAAPLLAVALLAVAGLRGTDELSSGIDPGEAGSAPVSAVARACAAFGTAQAGPAPLDLASTTLRGDAGTADGDNDSAAVPGGKVPQLAVRKPGQWASARVGAEKTTSVAVRSSGGLAPLSDAYAATRPDGDLGSGLAVQQCPQASATSWFVGAGSTANHPGTLVLTNPTEIDSSVDVQLYGADGAIEETKATGIVVKAGDAKRIPLERFAVGEDELALSVTTSRGVVSASVLDATGELSSYGGSDYLPAAARPAREAVVTGAPADADSRELLVANPSDRTADVSVTVAGKDGTFTPSGLQSVSVGAGAVKSVALPGNVGRAALSVRLSSQVPVTGAIRSLTSGGGGDLAYAVAQDGFEGVVPVPFTIGDGLDDVSVEIAAVSASPKKDGALRVRAHTDTGETLGKGGKVDLPAGETVSFDPLEETGAPAGRVAYLTVEPDGPRARAAVTYRDGDDWSSNPLTELPDRVVRPAVVPAEVP